MSGRARSLARSATAPIRDYINNHFEMVKQEIRAVRSEAPSADAPPADDGLAWRRLAELENLLAEQGHHQARVLARLDDDLADLATRIADLERVVRQLAQVVAARDDA